MKVSNRISRKAVYMLAVFSVLVMIPFSGSADDIQAEIQKAPLLSAMRAELSRAEKDLRLPDQPPPYFIEYWVQESASATLSGKYGGITHAHPDLHPRRYAGAQVRVGDYALDNTNLPLNQRFDQGSYAEFMEENDWRLREVPVDGDGAALRATLWMLSDMAYKRAIGDFQKKKTLRATGIEKDRADDFSREKAELVLDPVVEVATSLDSDAWKDAVRKVTGFLAGQPGVMEPAMDVQASRDTNYYVNTEGAAVRTSLAVYDIKLSAWTRTEDGMKVKDFRHFLTSDPKELPDLAKLMAEARALAQELSDLRSAEEFSPYTGPAILGPAVAGVFFHEALGHRP